MRIQLKAVFIAVAAFWLQTGCASMEFMTGRPDAVCRLAALEGDSVNGKVFFTQEEGYVLVEAELDGLSPGRHGIHIHEHGDCGGSAAAAAGAHFNPQGHSHGRAAMEDSHQGDLGNVMADSKGHARLSLKDPWLALSGEAGIMGRSVVLHAEADDLVGQPSGNSGARIACGQIIAQLR